MQEELLDIVNEQDEIIGVLPRSVVHEKGMRNFRVVNLFIQNSEGKLWIPRRQMSKRLAPGALDFSMGGHVDSGESYDEAFRRETQEELGIDTDAVPWTMVGKLTPHEDAVYTFEQVYLMHSDTVPEYNPTDFSEWFWLTPKEVLERIAQGEKAKSDLSLVVRYCFPTQT